MTREEALQKAGEIITKMAESIAKSGMHSVKEGELKEITEAIKD
jgi:hypothetical protein